MSAILEEIKEIPKLYHTTGCSAEQLTKAEAELGMTFPTEFREYVQKYGAISFYKTEWTGLQVEGYLNVIEATKQERELNPAFPR
ncbi:MAG: SMI1/KNR4 family protein, partial [Lachnospiraceae bacterium]|nr:SMI1/KNR4 family protein [Lachnospiraceae bacterium]